MLNSSRERNKYYEETLSHVSPVQVGVGKDDSYQYISVVDVLQSILQGEGVWEDILWHLYL